MLQELKLHNINPGYNFKIIGTNIMSATKLKNNILHTLRLKKCLPHISIFSTLESIVSRHDYYYKGKEYSVIQYSFNIMSLKFDCSDLVFLDSCYSKKQLTLNRYHYDITGPTTKYHPYNYSSPLLPSIEYSKSGIFFAIYHKIIQICEPEYELDYVNTFNKNPFKYNNVTKLVKYISNGYSMYHDANIAPDNIIAKYIENIFGKTKNTILYDDLVEKLKELKRIYCSIFCLKNYSLLLPNELHREIIKLLFLLCE